MKDELLSIKGLGKVALSKLNLVGINSLEDLVNADIEKLSEETGISPIKLKGWQVEARNILGVKESEEFPGIDELVEELAKKDKSEETPVSPFETVVKSAQNIDHALESFKEDLPEEEKIIAAPAPEPKEAPIQKPLITEEELSAEPTPEVEVTEELPEPNIIEEKEPEGMTAATPNTPKPDTEEIEVIDLLGKKTKTKEKPKKKRVEKSPAEEGFKKRIIFSAVLFAIIISTSIWLIIPTYKNYSHTSKAITYIFQGNIKKANVYITKIKPNFKNLIKLSLALMANKYYDQASELIKKAEKLKPDDPTPNNLLAELYLKVNNYGAAYLQAQEVLKKDIKNKEVHKILGLYYLKIGDLDNAYNEFKEYIRLKPKSAIGHLNYAKVLIKMNRIKEAEKHLNLSLKYTKSDLLSSSILEELGDIYVKKGNYNKALLPYKKARTQNPGNINIMYKLANVYFNIGNNSSAIRMLKDIKNLDPNYYPADILFGKIYYKKGNLSLAKSYFLKVIEKDYNNPEAIWHLAQIYYKEGDYVNAEIYLKKSIIIGIDEPKFYYYLAYINYYNKNYDRAYNYLRQIQEYFPNNFTYYYFQAYISILLNKLEEAYQTYKLCLTLKSDDGSIYNNLGVLSELKKEYKDAEMYYFNALELLTPKGIVSPLNIERISSEEQPTIRWAKIAKNNYYRIINKQYIKTLKQALPKLIFSPSPELNI